MAVAPELNPPPPLGIVGLGRMGAGIGRRLLRAGFAPQGFDPDPVARAELGAAHATLPELLRSLGTGRRAVWLSVPAGAATEAALAALAGQLRPGDIVVDGGNSRHHDTVRRAAELARRGVTLLDCGTSGGVRGEAEGYALMLGGDAAAVGALSPYLAALAPAPERGWGRVGGSGAGHYAKAVHNATEYGLMQAYAEGLELLAAHPDYALDPAQVAELWRHGSVIRSHLLDLAAGALADRAGAALEGLGDRVPDNGTARWAAADAALLGVPTPVLTAALHARLRSQQAVSPAGRLLGALRLAFGGHEPDRTAGEPKG